MDEELKGIIAKFADSGWDLIAEPSKRWLSGGCKKEELLAAVALADAECGSCGCEFDPLYKKILAAKALL